MNVVFGGSQGIGAAIVDVLISGYDMPTAIVDGAASEAHPELMYEEQLFPTSLTLGDHPHWEHVYVTFGQPSGKTFKKTDRHLEGDLIEGNFQAVTSAIRWTIEGQEQMPESLTLISSVSGLQGDPSGAIYGTMKAALDQLVRSLAREWMQTTRVNSIAPGPTATAQFLRNVEPVKQQFEKARNPIQKLVNPADVAIAAVQISMNQAITGQTLVVDYGGTTASRR